MTNLLDYIKDKISKWLKPRPDEVAESTTDDAVILDLVQEYYKRVYELSDEDMISLISFYEPKKVPAKLSYFDIKSAIGKYNYKQSL
jgi:hypothetical protein